jgi:hypothetical protein
MSARKFDALGRGHLGILPTKEDGTTLYAMKALLALLLTASPAFASGIWIDADCARGVVQKDGVITYFETPNSPGDVCEIAKADGGAIEVVCASGAKATLKVISDATIIWNGVEMTARDRDCG